MSPGEVKIIRDALSEALGVRLSQQDLGIALGLAPKNAARTIRDWETSGPTGPGAVALRLLLYCSERGLMDVVRAIMLPAKPDR
jgi:DNA-binding transcriptional regulator YiaG